jgi:hypothetical protein
MMRWTEFVKELFLEHRADRTSTEAKLAWWSPDDLFQRTSIARLIGMEA